MITRIAIFDFDGTLFKSPVKPDWWQKGWWGRPESLNPPCVPERPGSDWWNTPVVSEAKRAIGASDTYAVLLTGRLVSRFTERVRDLLRQAGLRFDEVILTPGGGTLSFKLKTIDRLLSNFPEIEILEMWDDRPEHTGEYRSHLAQHGIEFIIHDVPSVAKEPECLPGEDVTAAKVLARHLSSRKP